MIYFSTYKDVVEQMAHEKKHHLIVYGNSRENSPMVSLYF